MDSPQKQAAQTYFDLFNQHRFEETAALFAAAGQLVPPFDEAVAGPEAIAAYLKAEASRMKVFPKTFKTDSEEKTCQVLGYVHAIAFKVGVEWSFHFTQYNKIDCLSIKLRASMGDLLKMKNMQQ